MIGIGKLSLLGGYMLASALVCTPEAPPKVTLTFDNQPAIFDHSKSSAELGTLKGAHSASSDYGGEFPIVGGLMSGNFELRFNLSLSATVRDATKEACLYPKDIKVTAFYQPTIYVANDHKKGSCRYDLTLGHEMRHMNVDIITINESLPTLRAAVENVVAGWTGFGPLPEKSLQAEQDRLAESLKAELQKISTKFETTRNLRQQTVDTREEYRRMSTACPDERVE